MRFPTRYPSVKTGSLQAFTLIELLVVISIIAVLAGLLLPVANKVIENARKVTARSAMTTVVNSIKNYQAEYGSYPVVPAAGANPTDTTYTTAATGSGGHNSKVMMVLRALNNPTGGGTGSAEDTGYTALNARRIVYLEYRDVKNLSAPKDGFIYTPTGAAASSPKAANGTSLNAGDLVDPWGNLYGFRIDTSYSDKVADPVKNGSETSDEEASDEKSVHTAVIGWSLGPIKAATFASSDATVEASGNVFSWR